MIASSVFWSALVLIFYHHVGYPVLLRLLTNRRRQHTMAPPCAGRLPSVTLIVPCHNEAASIAAKVANLSALAYPQDRLSIVIALDGCTDGTRAIIDAALADVKVGANWQVIAYTSNVGKVAVLNDQIGRAGTDIVALSDASALLNSDALERAARHFQNPCVGVVCGTYRMSEHTSAGERDYWAYQRDQKVREALLAAPMGAHGAFYLFRRDLWSPLPADTINDDFILPMTIVLRGCRAIYDVEIIAYELERVKAGHEFRRRMRIGAGNLQQVLRLPALCDPRNGLLALLFISGKGLRAFMPMLLIGVFLSTTALATQGVSAYRLVLVGELSVAALALCSLFLPNTNALRPLRTLSYAASGYLAMALGFVLLLGGRGKTLWKLSSAVKTASARASESGSVELGS